MRSSSQHTFARVPSVDIPRSSFKRNMTYKTTFDAGYVVPFYVDEVLPGDTFNFHMSAFARILSPLKYPIMDNLFMDFQFFYVPTRLVYDDYEKFFGSSKGQAGNWEYDDSHVMPGMTFNTGVQESELGDYMGIPIGVKVKVNALPFRCYAKIQNDWFVPVSYESSNIMSLKTDSTDDDPDDYWVFKRWKRCDGFTGALPQPQRGPGAAISLAASAPVWGDGNPLMMNFGVTGSATLLGGMSIANDSVSGGVSFPVKTKQQQAAASFPAVGQVLNSSNVSTGGEKKVLGVATPDNALNSGLVADLSGVSAFSINDLRQAVQLQRMLERDMRAGGAQYVSQIMAHFGVRSPDARLQRSEYLGGGSMPINIHTVANTTGESGGNAQGSLAAFGVSGTNNLGWIKSFTEHGYVIGVVSVRQEQTYQQGLDKIWDRWTRFDFYYPVFAHLGEQPVLNKEIYLQAPTVVDSDGNQVNELPFGYQERFWEYRYMNSKVTGQLRSTSATPLDAWHLAQKFNNLPALNYQFLEEDIPMSRVKADTNAPDFLFDSLIQVNSVRPMPLFGVPGLLDHF